MTDVLRLSTDTTEEALRASAERHNAFPPDTAFPQLDELSDTIEELCSIIVKHGVQRLFRLRLLHRHTTIPEGQILVGTSIKEFSGFWTRAVSICNVDPQKIHPHIISADSCFNVGEGEMQTALLFPSEFREGRAAGVEIVENSFFVEFTACLRRKRLENTFGLEVRQGQSGNMIEFSFDAGSLLLDEKEVKAEVREGRREQIKLQETGWTVTVKDGNVCKTGETRCVTFPEGHIKVTDSKIINVSDALEVLRNEGVLA